MDFLSLRLGRKGGLNAGVDGLWGLLFVHAYHEDPAEAVTGVRWSSATQAHAGMRPQDVLYQKALISEGN